MNPNVPQPFTYWATIDRVIDGDTLVVTLDLGFNVKLTDVHMRVYGINCPEKDTEEGKDAIRYTKEWVAMDDINHLKPKQYKVSVQEHKKDKYGRILGEIFYGGESLGETLIKAKKAKPYFGVGVKPV
jgi:endonuclease YncB( thermonuclease family)